MFRKLKNVTLLLSILDSFVLPLSVYQFRVNFNMPCFRELNCIKFPALLCFDLTIYNGPYISSSESNSVWDCQAGCVHTPDCQTFTYNTESQICHLSNDTQTVKTPFARGPLIFSGRRACLRSLGWLTQLVGKYKLKQKISNNRKSQD